MDQRGSLVDTNLKIYPSKNLIGFIETIPITGDVPLNILRYIKDNAEVLKKQAKVKTNISQVQLTDEDIENLNKIKEAIGNNIQQKDTKSDDDNSTIKDKDSSSHDDDKVEEHIKDDKSMNKDDESEDDGNLKEDTEEGEKLYLTTSDIDWLYAHISKRKKQGEENVPFLHELFQGTDIVMPENKIIKRNPVLEARCVKLRAQQEAREYRKMTKGVDNVRMRFPEDSISYQLKQLNRQLIAIAQFILSIFAGFLFGFRGIEWMIGNLDFGVRLLLGVMCALIIALAEIYFLAKKLNEELTMAETVQLGGPPKFAHLPDYRIANATTSDIKEHQNSDNKEHQD
ncbi:uncharacterized protein [Epargyreus clarus]|uniref:uncharacterized protein n=1 Tax=Epargyreus clarus TaxID=520877 RepID=UPI003C2EF236